MLTAFLIKVPGQKPYEGIFASNTAAAQDAQQRFPEAAPASVLNLHFTSGRADFLLDDTRRFAVVCTPPLTDADQAQARARIKALITPAQEAR